MPLAAGARLGPYEILAPLGKGGMGEVYRALDTTLGREVAIKVLPDDLAGEPDRLARFKREAKVLASLNHPNIAHIYGVESQALVMELVEGQTLRSPLPLETALDYARQIAEALEAAHEKGIVHRDLKPANIMVTPAGLVKVLDFGLAKAADALAAASDAPTGTVSPTRAGVIIGTASYMSPEQARGAAMDTRSDIWTFGAVLFEMLAGKRAFAGDSMAEVLAAVMHGEPDWDALPRATPSRIRKLLRRCLERDRKQRLQAIGEARIAIDAPDEADARPLPRHTRMWPWAVAATLAVMLAIVAAAGWWRASRSTPLQPLIRLRAELGPDIKLESTGVGNILALSPDGTLLAAIIRDADGKFRVGTRRLDQSQIVPLAGTEDANSPAFSPDGQWIAFNSDRKLKKISVRGGAVATLGDVPNHMTGSWGDDGNIIVPLGWGAALSRISSAGGPSTPVTELNHEKGERRHFWPQVLPLSRVVLFTSERAIQNFDDADIEVISLQTGVRKNLYRGAFFARYLPSGHLVWVHQNALYAAPFDVGRMALTGEPLPVLEDISTGADTGAEFAFSQTGTLVYVSGTGEPRRAIFSLDRTGKTRPLQAAPGKSGFPRFSPDGKRLAFTAGDGRGHEDIWVRDLDRDVASRITLMPGANQSPVWTPDGGNLLFTSSNPSAPGIYSTRSDGAGVAQRLTNTATPRAQLAMSPDGKRLAMAMTNTRGGVEIWTARVEGEAGHPRLGTAEPFLQTPFVTIQPSFSPDGHWLAYDSREPGKEGLWVVPFPGPGGGWLVSSEGTSPTWSRSARELFFLSRAGIMVAGYAANGDALVFGKPQVWSQHPVLDEGSPPVATYDVAPDGRSAAVILNADGTAERKPITHLTFLLNFFDELRRRFPTGR
jgi:Tol biopolymer transport system component/predicted Ser/Thr protein kinase